MVAQLLLSIQSMPTKPPSLLHSLFSSPNLIYTYTNNKDYVSFMKLNCVVSSSELSVFVNCGHSNYFQHSTLKFNPTYSRANTSTPSQGSSLRIFHGQFTYKGALCLSPALPKNSIVCAATCRAGTSFQCCSLDGVCQFDWSRKQVVFLSVPVFGRLVSLCSQGFCKLFQNPNKGRRVVLSAPNSTKKICHHHFIVCSSLNDDFSSSPSKQSQQFGYDPAEELFDLNVDMPPRSAKSDAAQPRSWFGPNGQYIKELPCPSCRGRGYTQCAECGIERSRKDCPQCSGKGIMTCQQCLGECVIWEESIDEIPWEKARSISPLKVEEDDEVDNLDLKLDLRKKSKRVYRSAPEVGLKISRSLKSLNAKTGLFSKRMKIIHRDPALHAQRVAAIKKTKRTAAARKRASETSKNFFSDPENRRKRSISMKGVQFFCKNCGQEGHRSHYCPQLGEKRDVILRCGLCGDRGHNRLTCGKPKSSRPKQGVLQPYRCHACGQVGHNRRTCSTKAEPHSGGAVTKNGSSVKDSVELVSRHYKCSLCGETGHNSSTCPRQSSAVKKARQSYHCRNCGVIGHNRRTCSK